MYFIYGGGRKWIFFYVVKSYGDFFYGNGDLKGMVII